MMMKMQASPLSLLQVLVVVLVVVVGGRGQQAGHVADALGHALSEQQLGAQPQVLGVLEEAEADHGALAGAELLLQQREGRGQGGGAWLLTRRGVSAAGAADLPLQALHRGRLAHVAHVHGDLGAPAEGLGVEQQHDGGLEAAADGRVHLGADQNHPLKQPITRQRRPTSCFPPKHGKDISWKLLQLTEMAPPTTPR